MTELNFADMWKERQLESFEGEIWKQCTVSAFYEIRNYGRINKQEVLQNQNILYQE